MWDGHLKGGGDVDGKIHSKTSVNARYGGLSST